MNGDSVTCPLCGYAMPAKERYCPRCGSINVRATQGEPADDVGWLESRNGGHGSDTRPAVFGDTAVEQPHSPIAVGVVEGAPPAVDGEEWGQPHAYRAAGADAEAQVEVEEPAPAFSYMAEPRQWQYSPPTHEKVNGKWVARHRPRKKPEPLYAPEDALGNSIGPVAETSGLVEHTGTGEKSPRVIGSGKALKVFLLELLGYIGFLGIGHMYSGNVRRGTLLLIGWWLYMGLIMRSEIFLAPLPYVIVPFFSGFKAAAEVERRLVQARTR